jgi:hypothetical protein
MNFGIINYSLKS